MQVIQLYIKNTSGEYERIDMFEDESVSITQSIRNAKDVGKLFTSFTKQFTVPASKKNNRIFKHYYNFDILNGFDARTRKISRIELNNTLFKDGRLRMDGVDLKNNTPFSYRVTFFGSIVELKDVLGEDKLTDLSELNIEMPYVADDIYENLTNLTSKDIQGTPVDGISLPLITFSQRLYYDSGRSSEQSGNIFPSPNTAQGIKFEELKYAVRLDKIINAIESQYTIANGYLGDIIFEGDSFFKRLNSDTSKLYMWCHRKKGKPEIEPQQPVSYPFISGPGVSNGVYTLNAPLGYQIRVVEINTTVDQSTSLAKYDILIFVNGLLNQRFDEVTGSANKIIELGDSYNDGDQVSVQIQGRGADVLFLEMNMVFGYFIEYPDESYDYTEDVAVAQSNFNVQASATGYSFNIQQQMPEMKIIDFFSSLFKMFNLVAYVNEFGRIEVETLDDFYQNTEHNITKYVDITASSVDSALPYREIQFKYEDTKTILAEQHFQEIANIEWGAIEFNNTETLDGEIYRVTPNFHHAKYEKLIDLFDLSTDTGVMYCYFVDDNEEEYIGKPLITYINNISPNLPVSFLSGTESKVISVTEGINMPSNLESMTVNSSNNTHFDSEINEYTNVEATGSLFERFYKKYISNIFDPRSRLTRVNAVLPVSKIVKISLQDILVIGQRKYRINSMTTNLKDGRTDFELINYYSETTTGLPGEGEFTTQI